MVIFHWVFIKFSYENENAMKTKFHWCHAPNENFTFHRENIFCHWIFMDKTSSSFGNQPTIFAGINLAIASFSGYNITHNDMMPE